MTHAFNIMHASGIHNYWMDLFFWMQASPRIQDVNKYKSISEVKPSTGNKVWPLIKARYLWYSGSSWLALRYQD